MTERGFAETGSCHGKGARLMPWNLRRFDGRGVESALWERPSRRTVTGGPVTEPPGTEPPGTSRTTKRPGACPGASEYLTADYFLTVIFSGADFLPSTSTITM